MAGAAETPAQTQQADRHVQQHAAHAAEPYRRQLVQQCKPLCRNGLHHRRALLRRRGKVGFLLLAEVVVDLGGGTFGLLEADGAFWKQGGGQQQAQGNQQPKQAYRPLRSPFFQKKSNNYHRQGDEGGLPGDL